MNNLDCLWTDVCRDNLRRAARRDYNVSDEGTIDNMAKSQVNMDNGHTRFQFKIL